MESDQNLTIKIKPRLHFRKLTAGPVSLVKHFSYKDIKRATDGFRRNIDNSFQTASYRAKFQDGLLATVKEVRGFGNQDDAFYREVQLLGRLHHRHIVSLNGFCVGQKRFLVFENAERGSLKEYLSDPLKTPLSWRTRLQIAMGIAAALEYLHFFCDPPVYHVSISTSTIMLDENFTAKLSSISILCPAGSNPVLGNSCSKECTGTVCKNTVFQLGLLILELITGHSSDEGNSDLIQWAQGPQFSRSMHNMIDPDLGNNYNLRELNGLLAVARLCIKSMDKPKIHTPHILWYLQKKLGTLSIKQQ